jgi:ribonucleoside-diphosphate reductase alpha chain
MNVMAPVSSLAFSTLTTTSPGWTPRVCPAEIEIDRSRDALLTGFGKATMDDRYLMPNESYQDLFARVSAAYADDAAHAQRIYDYMSKLWFMPATPVLSNGGTDRGMPISCFLNEASDSLEGIVDLWNENVWLASRGGGIGSYFGNLRSIGEKIGEVGKTSGAIPFIRVMDSLTLAISQGSLRRGAAAVYLPISHPEVEEFVDMRRSTGGDHNRKTPNLHHGIMVSDAFMRAVESDLEWEFTSPKTGLGIRSVGARALWIRILTARLETGEPYLVFSDHVAKAQPEQHKAAGLRVKLSNLCTEITLPTGTDHHGRERTAVCCLSSLNLENWFEWKDVPMFVEDIMRFLDNVLQSFIDNAPPGMEKAVYSAARERSVGLGVMGFHSFLQSMGVPWESAIASVWNRRMFKHIRLEADRASVVLADERGACPDAAEFGIHERFSHKMSVAPTASISVIAGNSSPGIEPISGNAYLQKTLAGSFIVRNRHLQKLLAGMGKDTTEVWSSITTSKGSVQHLDFLSEPEKMVYKTAFELDQRWVVEHAADRTPYICQAQSVNLFLPADVDKRDLHEIHFLAWAKGLKSLYYCRSMSIGRAETIGVKTVRVKMAETEERKYETCQSCQ